MSTISPSHPSIRAALLHSSYTLPSLPVRTASRATYHNLATDPRNLSHATAHHSSFRSTNVLFQCVRSISFSLPRITTHIPQREVSRHWVSKWLSTSPPPELGLNSFVSAGLVTEPSVLICLTPLTTAVCRNLIEGVPFLLLLLLEV